MNSSMSLIAGIIGTHRHALLCNPCLKQDKPLSVLQVNKGYFLGDLKFHLGGHTCFSALNTRKQGAFHFPWALYMWLVL